jgi:amidase
MPREYLPKPLDPEERSGRIGYGPAMDFVNLDATAQAELVRTRAVTPAELVDAAIARIERSNPELGAVIWPMFEEARQAARGPLPDGPFKGVPFLVKDIIAQVKGAPYTAGTRPLKAANFVSPRDSYLVESFRKAGFVICGKTNTSELGIVPSAEPDAHGAAHNPYDLSRSTGGSSGGSAAAVAAGLVPVAHANDGGGSIRIPASCCGLVGLKPSRGRTSLGPDWGSINGGLVCEHVVARSVRDTAHVLDLVHGPRPGDPYAAPTPARPYKDEVGAPVGRLKIGFATRYLNPQGQLVPVHAEAAAAVDHTAKLCASLGHHVEEAHIDALEHPEYVPRFLAVWATGVAADLEGIELLLKRKISADEVEPLTWGLAQVGKSVSAPGYVNAWNWLMASARAVASFFERYDLWLTPTTAAPPPRLGAFRSTPDNPLGGIFAAAEFTPFTPPFNATGQPAISVPLYRTADGLPIGSHLVAAYGREDLLIRVASQLEAAQPFVHAATGR